MRRSVLWGAAILALLPFVVDSPADWIGEGVHSNLLIALFYLCLTVLFGIALYAFNTAIRGISKERRVLRGVVHVVFNTIGALVVLEVAFWIATVETVARADEGTRRIFLELFAGDTVEPAPSVHYETHHYLNYVLARGRMTPSGAKEINPTYRIRRKEPIRPRDAVRWRALVIGGSTTFDEFIDEESDTWVHRLEEEVRSKYGPDYDVINGGVPGYTIQENIIHYTTMLMHLRPDVVVLFVGLNDVHPRYYGTNAIDYSNYRIIARRLDLAPVNPVLRSSWTYRFIYERLVLDGTPRTGLGGVTRKEAPPEDEQKKTIRNSTPEIYESKLDFFVAALVAENIRVLVLPQQYDANASEVLALGVIQHNFVNQSIAAKHHVPYCPGTSELFPSSERVDDCHFNVVGARHMARVVFDCLVANHLLEPDPQRCVDCGAIVP